MAHAPPPQKGERVAKLSRGVIGIDLGGTKTLLALFDERFNLITEIKMKTEPEKSGKRFMERVLNALHTLLSRADADGMKVMGVGLGCAGLIDEENGVIVASPNIPFLKKFPIAQTIEHATGLRVRIRNDVQAGLYGEHQLGAARGCRTAIGVFIGTGIGGALIVKGNLHRGVSGMAGELGRFLVAPMGPLSGSERHGILDDVASRTAIAAEAAALAAKQWAPSLLAEVGTDLANIRSNALARSIKAGDIHVEELVRSRSRLVGIAVANLVNFLAPDMVVFGGGLVEAMGEIIVPEAEAALKMFTDPLIFKHLRVAAAELGGHCITAGAAHMAWQSLVK